jgi:exosome complex RNA-binding protein Rrp42 (RNase PH superfamily)
VGRSTCLGKILPALTVYVYCTLYSLVVLISAEVTKPREDRPYDGVFTIALELTNMGSPAWENGRYGSPRG